MPDTKIPTCKHNENIPQTLNSPYHVVCVAWCRLKHWAYRIQAIRYNTIN